MTRTTEELLFATHVLRLAENRKTLLGSVESSQSFMDLSVEQQTALVSAVMAELGYVADLIQFARQQQ